MTLITIYGKTFQNDQGSKQNLLQILIKIKNKNFKITYINNIIVII